MPMSESENNKLSNRLSRRTIISGLVAGGISLFLSEEAQARAQRKSLEISKKDSYDDPSQELLKAPERLARARTVEFEEELRRSPLFDNGPSNELQDLFRRGLPDQTRPGQFIAGPNDSLPSPQIAPSLYPQFKETNIPNDPHAYSGVEVVFNSKKNEGQVFTNGTKVGKTTIIIPSQVRSKVFSEAVETGVDVVKDMALGYPNENAGIAKLPSDLTDAHLHGKYAVAFHTQRPHGRGPWGAVESGRIPLTGYIVNPKDHSGLQTLIQESINNFVLPDDRNPMQQRMEKSLVMVGNIFEWAFIQKQLREGSGGLGQPVYVRTEGNHFEFCGIIHTTLLLNTLNKDFSSSAVAYVIYGPDVLRPILEKEL